MSADRAMALIRMNAILFAHDPGPLIGRVAMPLVLITLMRPLYAAAIGSVAGTAAAVAGMLVTFSLLGMSIVGSSILVERMWHTAERLRSSPATTIELLVGKAGPALAGVLIGAVGGARTLIGNGLAFLVSALALWLIRLPQREVTTGEEPGDGVPVLVAIRQGISFVRHHRILRMILLCTTVSNFFTMGLTSVEIVFMVRVLHSTPVVIGLLFTLGAVGGFVSGLLAARVSRWLGSARVIWLSMLLPGPFYLLMPLARPGWWVLLYAAGTAAFSANIGLFNASATSYRLAVCPSGLLGRVNATFLWVCYGAIPLGAVTGGLVAAWLGLRGAVLVCVVGIWSAALFVVFSPLRSMRDVPSGEQPTG